VAVNTPFRGTYVPLAHLRSEDRRVSSLMIELRRDGYLREPDGPATPGLPAAAAALAALVDAAGGVG
jgi:N-formylglutamate deformylase